MRSCVFAEMIAADIKRGDGHAKREERGSTRQSPDVNKRMNH